MDSPTITSPSLSLTITPSSSPTPTFQRKCGSCTACCRLVPVGALNKPALQRCEHQRMGVGCRIYASRPVECRLWSCMWLLNKDVGDLPRPDRAGYCIDLLPDFVSVTPNGAKHGFNQPVLQVWADPKRPDAWRTKEFLAYAERRGTDGYGILIRYGSERGVILFPPTLTGYSDWIEERSALAGKRHSQLEIMEVLRDQKLG